MKKTGKTIGVCAVGAAMAVSLLFGPEVLANHTLGYTSSDIAYNSEYESTLKSIRDNYNIQFINYDLYNCILNQLGHNFTVEELRNIESLTLDMRAFSNKDLSDLKYFTGLKRINLSNGVIDCSNFMYNQNLNEVTLTYCDVTNTKDIPNTVNSLRVDNCRITDTVLQIPYGAQEVYSGSTVFNKVRVKNPSGLQIFSFSGYSFFDLNDIKDCTNLRYLYLRQCPNISNPNVLNNFENCKVTLDEFCCVWGNPDCYEKLPKEYKKIMRDLDQIANSLTNSTLSDEEKVEQLTMYILAQIEYDFSCIGESDAQKEQLTDYNNRPISYAIYSNKGVCVGYATLFKALANRVGLDSYQPDSINHTWNMVKLASDNEYRAYDLTQLDNPYAVTGSFSDYVVDESHSSKDYILADQGDDLLFYNFDFRDANRSDYSYTTNVEKVDITDYDKSLGYINYDSSSSKKELNTIRCKLFLGEVGIIFLLITLSDMFSKNKNKQNKTKVKRQNTENRYC